MAPEQELDGRLKKVRRKRGVRRLALRLALTAGAVYLLLGVVFGLAVVRGDSMSPTLREGDLALFLRIVPRYQAGDVVLVEQDGEELVKRVVALPGQTVDIDGAAGTLLVDGTPLNEPYLTERTEPKEGISYPLTLGADEYFVLGDHRENSRDSRNYGPVAGARLDGKLLLLLRRQR